MGNLLEYSGIVTKIRAMNSKLLTPAQFQEIANLNSVLEIVDYLKKNTSYADVLETLTEEQLHVLILTLKKLDQYFSSK